MKTLFLRILPKVFIAMLCVCYGESNHAQIPDFAWARTINSTGTSPVQLLAIDEQGNSYVAGFTSTSITINGTTVTNTTYGGGGSARYLIKYDSDGNGLWIRNIPFHMNKLLVHRNKLYIAGIYGGSLLHFDGIPLPASSGTSAYCLVRMNEDGIAEWIRIADYRGLSTGGVTDITTIFADRNNNIQMTGVFQERVDFDNGTALVNQSTNPASLDAFRTVYDTLGNVLDIHQLGVINSNYSSIGQEEHFDIDAQNNLYRYVTKEQKLTKYSEEGQVIMEKSLDITGAGSIQFGGGMAVDTWGNIFLSGSLYGGSVTIEGTFVSKYSDIYRNDAVVLKLNATDGSLSWIDRNEYVHCDYYETMITDEMGNVYLAGSHSLCLGGSVNGLLVKYANDGTRIWEEIIEPGPPANPVNPPPGWTRINCIAQSNDGGNILIAGSFRERIKFDDVTSFTGTSNDRGFIAQYGICNTLKPVINAVSIDFCQGDSVELTVTPIPGYNYLWSNGETSASIFVGTPGNYSVAAIENQECYASEKVTISEHSLPDTSITIDGATLSAVSDYSYQWLDCNNGYALIAGATASTFTPQQNGSYAVVLVNSSGCIDTSACYVINNLGLEQKGTEQPLSVYPNPANTTIRIANLPQNAVVSIRDMTGKIVYRGSHPDNIDVSKFRNGVYIVEVRSEKITGNYKFVVSK